MVGDPKHSDRFAPAPICPGGDVKQYYAGFRGVTLREPYQ
jgi:hypothetical protein